MKTYSKIVLERAAFENRALIIERITALLRKAKIPKKRAADLMIQFGYSSAMAYRMLTKGFTSVNAISVMADLLDADLQWLIMGTSLYEADFDFDKDEFTQLLDDCTVEQRDIVMRQLREFQRLNRLALIDAEDYL